MARVRVDATVRSNFAPGLESDVRVVSEIWFGHDEHESIDQFICSFPMAYFIFDAHDCYTASTRYRMDTLFRISVLKECHGWSHETAIVRYLRCRPELCEQLGLETVPDQSTLWRTWHQRFTAELCETVQKAARTILIKARNADVAVPREPERSLPPRGDDADESDPDNRSIPSNAETITEHVSRVVRNSSATSRSRQSTSPIREQNVIERRERLEQALNE